MSLSSSPGTTSVSTTFKESMDSPDTAMPPFIPGQCLFCPTPSPSFPESVIHMQKFHGLFVPHQQDLVVDLETLFKYLHLIIFGYRECVHCGTERTTVQAVQQHMTGKGHCKFDITEQDSEFAEFYDFSEPEEDTEDDVDVDGDESNEGETATSSRRKPMLADEDSIRLPSGKIISKQSSAQIGPSFIQLRHRTRVKASQLEYSPVEAEGDDGQRGESSKEEHDMDSSDTRLLSKREKREKATVTHQLINLRANDRTSLMHLSSAEQRSMLVTQHRQGEKAQKEEKRRQTKVDRKGNKNLYAYWHTETPVYTCG